MKTKGLGAHSEAFLLPKSFVFYILAINHLNSIFCSQYVLATY